MKTSILVILLGATIGLGGCAKFSADGGMAEVATGVRQETGKDVAKISDAADVERTRQRVGALLAAPLSADAAVQVALLNNRGLQAAYNDLGITEAAYVQASLPPNPGISLMQVGGTGVANFEARLAEDILSLLTLPRRTDIAASEFERGRYLAIEATLRLAADTRRAYIRAVASRQQIGFLEQARGTVDAAARLVSKLGETGGGDQLDQAELAAFYAELSAQLGQARLTARRDRETLVRLMGLWGSNVDFALPAELPPLPAQPDTVANVEAEAIRRRLDLRSAHHEVETMAKTLRLTEATRYVSMLQLAGIANNESANPRTNSNTDIARGGAQIDLRIPIFDTGEARTRSARETYMRAVNLLAEKAVNVRSEARIAYETYRGTYDIARFWQDRVLPLRQIASQEIMLRYNNAITAGEGMRVDLFKYLTDARTRIAANASALDARRDFFVADADLQAALTVSDPSSQAPQPATMK
jgi:outer membrane protein TolC